MAVLPKIVYNFNENSTTTIRDYSENGNDGTGTNLSTVSSGRVGYDMVFNTSTDQIDMGNITDLNGVSDCAFHFGIFFSSGEKPKEILTKSGQIDCTIDHDTNTFSFSLTVASGTATVTKASLVNDQFYDIDVVWASDVLTLYIDGTSENTDSTESGVVATSSNTMYIGDGGSSKSANFNLNEFKLYDEAITTTIIDAVIAEQNGLNVDVGTEHNFALGDIIGHDFDGSPKYAVVSFVGINDDYRFLPLTDNISSGMVFQRVGNLFDTTRQWALKIDNTPQICFYDNVSLSSEVFTAAKKTHCINREGIVKNSSDKTGAYTVVSSDQRIYVDSSSGAFTITLEVSPSTNRELEIIDKSGSCNTNTVTVDGNGNNIIGSTTYSMNTSYEALKLIFNGDNWNLN